MSIELTMLYKLRFQQQAHVVATEVSSNGPAGIADILAIKNDKVYEYEVKRSKSDFYQDFKKNSYGVGKHVLYSYKELLKTQNVMQHYANMKHFVPDYFYFVVPEELKEVVLDYLKANEHTKYGLITVSDRDFPYQTVIKPSTCVRRAKQLESCVNLPKVRERIIARQSSELINAKMDLFRALKVGNGNDG